MWKGWNNSDEINEAEEVTKLKGLGRDRGWDGHGDAV